jgi:hypothetical protein
MAANPVEQIVAGLTPYIGAHMARSAAEAHCRARRTCSSPT